MKQIISKDHFFLRNKDNILNVSQKANLAISNHQSIINASIGMLYDEEGKLADFPIVDKLISESNDELNRKYGGVSGRPAFKTAIINWLFDGVDLTKLNVGVIPTIGATGALFLSMRNYVDKNQPVLAPNIRWSNYDNIADQLGLKIEEYNLFNGDKFDLLSVKKCVTKSLSKFHRAYIIINDPCQNPTGYSLSFMEWKTLLNSLKTLQISGQIVLMVDIAYLNYSNFDYSKIINLMSEFISDNFMIHFAFSAAKTLSIYGLRGGAFIALAKSKKEIEAFETSCKATARAVWSMPNNVANNVIEKCFLIDENRNSIKKQLIYYTTMLKKRSDLYFEECKKYGLINKPYRNGFFVLLECKNNEKLSDKLCEKNVFAIPLSGGLRISLASITLKQIPQMVDIIGEVIKSED